jgi:hypothetical protein
MHLKGGIHQRTQHAGGTAAQIACILAAARRPPGVLKNINIVFPKEYRQLGLLLLWPK